MEKHYYALVSFPHNPKNPEKQYVFKFDSFIEKKSFEEWAKEIKEHKIKVLTQPDGPFNAVLKDVLWVTGEDPDFDVAAALNATLPIKPLYGVRYCVAYTAQPCSRLEAIPLSNIQVPWSFSSHLPRSDKFATHYEAFVKALGEREKFTDPVLPGSVKVRKTGSGYILVDGFCNFLLYRAFGAQTAVVDVLDSPPVKRMD